MDKNTYATYEYLQTNNPETESDQFFVIQDDGTFLLNRQVQYVAEVQDGNNEELDSTQACTVYDVNPQQFFVDVGNNPTELISVADNYILPAPEEVNNLYRNSFLLQNVGTEAPEQVDKDLTITVQFNEAEKQASEAEELDVVNIVNKQGQACTEITLSDEQYTSLEQKGWVLIESNGKIFILDAFGLHEVTSNNDLIQNLKEERNIDLPVVCESTGIVLDNQTNLFNTENIAIQDTPQEQEDVTDNEVEFKVVDNAEEDKVIFVSEPPAEASEETRDTRQHPEAEQYKCRKIKILTKYNFKDIPDKIVLGKTSSGKKLVAKVVKRTYNEKIIENGEDGKPEGSSVEPKPPESSENEDSSKDIDDAEFEKLMQSAVSGNVTCSSEEVINASDIIMQLLQVPEFSTSVAGRNMVITRVNHKASVEGTRRTITFVSGFVKSIERGGLLFIHVPDLLQKLTFEYEDYFQRQSSRSVLKPMPEQIPDCKILQVHLSETKHCGAQAISFILNERFLPCKFANNKVYPRKITKLHACSTCAAIFQSDSELKEHQESHAMESEGTLTIDTDKLSIDTLTNGQSYTVMENRYYIMKTKKGTEYCCFQCPKKFNKLSNCIRHMKLVHEFTITNPKDSKEEIEKIRNNIRLDAPYKCKMCTSAYYYPVSLSKHISKTHIKAKVNTMIQT